MNILEILDTITEKAGDLNIVNSTYIGDVYDNLNNKPDVKYGVVTADITDLTRNDYSVDYTVYIYYADRTLQDNSNVKQIQADAVNVLESVINAVVEELNGEASSYTINLFQQKFNDYCAGGYVQFTLTLESELGRCSMESDFE